MIVCVSLPVVELAKFAGLLFRWLLEDANIQISAIEFDLMHILTLTDRPPLLCPPLLNLSSFQTKQF